MQILVNSDSSLAMDAALSGQLEATVAQRLERYASQITRVEVHVSDTNRDKGGLKDKRCVMEARVSNRAPEVVTAEAAEVEAAVRDASVKMERLLESLFGRLEDRR
jgi:ribosome-associated translation inhibitor RaiA